MLDSSVRVSRRVGSLRKNPDLGDAQQHKPLTPGRTSMTKHPSPTKRQQPASKNPSRCLTPQHGIPGGCSPHKRVRTPAPYSPAPKSHLSGSQQLESRTGVPRQTVTSAIGATRFTLNGFRYFSLSFQSSFHLSLTVLVRYRSPANI